MGEADSHSFLVICRFRLAATMRVVMRPLLACLVPVIPAQAGIQTSAHHAARKISASERATFSESDFFLT
jgi:hypothetical protein